MKSSKANSFQGHSFFAYQPPLQHLQSEPYQKNFTPSMSDTHRQLAEAMQQNSYSIPMDQAKQPRFYDQYKKIFTVSHHIALEKSRLQKVLLVCAKRLKNIEDKMKAVNENNQAPKISLSEQTKIKRLRRTDEEIQKKYQCTLPHCDRFYSSEGSLHQHIKLKHSEFNNQECVNISSSNRE